MLVHRSCYSLDVLIRAVNNIPDVKKLGNIRCIDTGTELVADETATVAANLSTLESHRIANSIERLLADTFDIQDIVVHIEPDVG